ELHCTVEKSATFADHLVFSTAARGAPIALVGHLDTVFPPGTFEGYRREGPLALGPGVLDMKGGLLVAGYALLALARTGALAHLPVRFVIVSDEEVGSPEGAPLLRRIAGGACCGLVFEAGRMNDAIVTQRKGTGNVTAVARGRAAHSGNLHHEGVNAIWALGRFVDRAQQLTHYDRGITVNVGRIEGGQSRNTVPDTARAELDIRFVSASDGEALVAELESAAAWAAASVAGASIELSGGVSRVPFERSPSGVGLFDEYAACALASGLGAVEAPLVGGGSDANTLSALGVPCIDALGPRGSGFHTRDERIEVATLLPKCAALVRFLVGRLQ
ncbi:MAG TPA: M20/M25/M40 family metallo-hydrolase, partial [Polyangiaceae bacterium]|nr:M20/M25/M40 family metallo-hydrolase [Polyangiaceae bacterium]